MDGYKFIDKIGIELEAAWKEPKRGLVIDESFSPADFSPEFKGVGEFVSHPIASKEEMLNWLHTNWPDETCAKCAMHVHFSLNHINFYSACMSNRFYEYFLNEMEKWGKTYNCRNELFWGRLRGDNRYCRKRFNPDVQVKYVEKGHNRQDRRDHWNFCYGLHKTMECRLLPMFKNIETAKSAIFALINCIETYLDQYTQEEKHVVDELFDFDCVQEEREAYTDEHENRYQELANTPGISPEQRREFEKLMNLRRIHRAPKREKSKFAFNYFEVWNPNVNSGNAGIKPNKFMPKSPTLTTRVMDRVAEEMGIVKPKNPYIRAVKGKQITLAGTVGDMKPANLDKYYKLNEADNAVNKENYPVITNNYGVKTENYGDWIIVDNPVVNHYETTVKPCLSKEDFSKMVEELKKKKIEIGGVPPSDTQVI